MYIQPSHRQSTFNNTFFSPAGIRTPHCQLLPQTRPLITTPWHYYGGSSCTPSSSTCISKSFMFPSLQIYLTLKETVKIKSCFSPLSSVTYSPLPLDNIFYKTSHSPSPAGRTSRTSNLLEMSEATLRSRWTHRQRGSSTRRSWTAIGQIGFTRFPVPPSYLALCTSTHPSAASSWWWWPCWCFTCKCSAGVLQAWIQMKWSYPKCAWSSLPIPYWLFCNWFLFGGLNDWWLK